MTSPPLGKLISQIHRYNQKNLTKEFAPYQIGGGGQHSFLISILSTPGINQDQLVQQLKFDKATTARAVKQLELQGYIERKVNEQDRRSLSLFPTEKAVQFSPTLDTILDQHNERLEQSLSDAEKIQLTQLLQKIFKDLDD